MRRVVLTALLAVIGCSAPPASARTDSSSLDTVGEDAISARARRATVTATYMVLPSGRLRVSLRSDAARVKLTYSTPRKGLRSKFVRIRKGTGAATVAKGSRKLTVRALATSRLRASTSTRVRRNPLLRDADGNGILDYQYDVDSDGRYETALFDDDRNGRFEMAFFDTGAISGLFKDQNDDGYFELVALDANRDGKAERLFYDADRDGYPELQCLDYIGPDGVADTWVDTSVQSKNLQQDRAAEDLMVKNIVTLNQLRQLNPSSTGYIRYNPAPSLLRPHERADFGPR